MEQKKAITKRARRSSLVQAIYSVTGNFVKELLKLTLPVPLSYCHLVTFYNCFTISQQIHTQYIPSTTVSVIVRTWEGDGKMSCFITHTHTKIQTEETCAIPSHPKPTTNSYPKKLISLLQLKKFLLFCWATVTPCALLTLYSCSVKHVRKHTFFTTKQSMGNCFSTRETFVKLDQAPIPKPIEAKAEVPSINSNLYLGTGSYAALLQRYYGTSSTHTVHP